MTKRIEIEFKSSVEIMNTPMKKRRFIVDEMIYPGLHVLSGDPKIGKSWMMMDMCLAIAKGEKFLGRKTEQGHVVYMALEDTSDNLQTRMYELTDEPTDNLQYVLLVNTLGNGLEDDLRKQFCFYMKQYGYDVKWEDSRKYITYTCPNGRRCRDNKLHEAKYRKENMEYEFEIRRSERSLQTEFRGDTGHTNYGLRPGTQLAGADLAAETSDRYDVRCQGSDRRDNDICTDETVPAKSADYIRSGAETGTGDSGADVAKRDGRGIEAGSGGEGPYITGWEAERADLIAAEMLRRAEQKSRLQTAPTGGADRIAAPDIVSGIAAVASIIEDEPADDTEYAREHVDSKALAEERERKEAHGIHMG